MQCGCRGTVEHDNRTKSKAKQQAVFSALQAPTQQRSDSKHVRLDAIMPLSMCPAHRQAWTRSRLARESSLQRSPAPSHPLQRQHARLQSLPGQDAATKCILHPTKYYCTCAALLKERSPALHFMDTICSTSPATACTSGFLSSDCCSALSRFVSGMHASDGSLLTSGS